MSDTKIDPLKFEELSVSQYRRLLLKDMTRLSRTSSFKEYVYLYNYKLGSKRTDILLFADPEDAEWSAILKKVRGEAKKEASGLCKIVQAGDRDMDGDEDFTLAIKTAQGSLKKSKVIEHVNERLFGDDPDVEAVLLKDVDEDGEDENLDDKSIIAKRKTETGSGGFNKAMNKAEFLKATGINERTGDDAEKHPTMKAFLVALDGFFGAKTAEQIMGGMFSKMKSLQSSIKSSLGDSDKIQNEVIPTAKALQESLDKATEDLGDIIDKGRDWLEGPGEKVTLKFKIKATKKEGVKAQLAFCNQMLKKLLKLEATFDDLFGEAFKQNFQLYSNIKEEHYEERKEVANQILLIVEEWKKQNASSDNPEVKAQGKKLDSLKSKLDKALVGIEKKIIEATQEVDKLAERYTNYVKKYDPYRKKTEEELKAEKGKSVSDLLKAQQTELLNIFKDMASWKKTYPEIHTKDQQSMWRAINKQFYAMETADEILREEIKIQERLDVYRKGDIGKTQKLLKDPTFINDVNHHMPLSEYVETFQKDAEMISLFSSEVIDISDLPDVPVVTAPNPELDIYYFIPAGTELRHYVKNKTTNVFNTTPHILGDKFIMKKKDVTRGGGGQYILQRKETNTLLDIFYLAAEPSEIPFEDVSDKNLFGDSGRPAIADIRQGDVGDCWLMAALGSIVNNQPQHIEKMLHDDGKGHVFVRMFDVTRTTEQKEVRGKMIDVPKRTFKAKILKVSKDLPKFRYNPNNGIWVRIIEKAYTMGGFTGSYGRDSQQKQSKIQGGWAEFAFEVLMGRSSVQDKTVQARYSNDVGDSYDNAIRGFDVTGPIFSVLPWAKSEVSTFNKAVGEDYSATSAHGILEGDKANVKKWFEFVKKGTIKKLFDREHSAKYSGQVTIEDLEAIFDGKFNKVDGSQETGLDKLDGGVKTAMVKFLKTQRLFPGKLGTGFYSKLHESTYELIRKALKDDNKMVALTAKSTIALATEVTGSGSSGGEDIAAGLAGKHVYTGLDCKLDSDGLMYVLVRNPWGSSTRSYKKASEALEEVNTKIAEAMKNASVDPYKTATEATIKGMDHQTLEAALLTCGINTNRAIVNLMKERKSLSRFEATDMVPVKEAKVEETGESWIELSDLTKRFYSIEVV